MKIEITITEGSVGMDSGPEVTVSGTHSPAGEQDSKVMASPMGAIDGGAAPASLSAEGNQGPQAFIGQSETSAALETDQGSAQSGGASPEL